MSQPEELTNEPTPIEEEFEFVGESGTAVEVEKISWNQNAQAIIIRNRKQGKMPARAAYEAGAAEYNALLAKGEITDGGDLSPLPESLPKSYSNKNAGSVLYGMFQRFKKRCMNKDARNHAETLAAALRFGVIRPKAASTEQPAPEQVDESVDSQVEESQVDESLLSDDGFNDDHE